MRFFTVLLASVLCLPAFAGGVEEVRQAEIGFAKAFADRDKAKFFSYVADDAVFLSALGTLRGKAEVIERWSRFFDGVPVAPFSWGPERVELTSHGTIGFSMGPIYGSNGKHGGYYSSIWQKQKDGTWKVIVDGPGNPSAPLRETAAPLEEAEAARVVAPQEHHACRRRAGGVGGGDHHRVGVVAVDRARLGVPAGELDERVRRDRVLRQLVHVSSRAG